VNSALNPNDLTACGLGRGWLGEKPLKAGASQLRWVMIGMAFLATAITYLERGALSVTVPVLTDQLHMTSVGYSRVIFAFMLA